MKIIHIINSLHMGGAERQLEQLVSLSPVNTIVVSLISDKTLIYDRLIESGISVKLFNIKVDGYVHTLFKLRQFLISEVEKETLIQSWLYISNLLSFIIVKSISFKLPILWSIRRSSVPSGINGVVSRVCGLVSKLVKIQIVCCAKSGIINHINSGYSCKNFHYIPNIVNHEVFKPSENFLKINASPLIIGTVGRNVPEKGYYYLAETVKYLLGNNEFSEVVNNIKFVLIGRNLNFYDYFESDVLLQVKRIVTIVDETEHVDQYMKSFDVYCQPSLTEGFPNVLAESMASGAVPIATNVGDTSIIVGETGYLVNSKSAVEISNAIRNFYNLPDKEKIKLKKMSVSRVKENFSSDRVISDYTDLYDSHFINIR
jgi:glycosyltransferase involved in cell wall biosynthesis